MSHSVSFRNTTLTILCIALVQFCLQVSLLARGVEYIAGSLAIDDTYYYLQTAWNTKLLGFVTFDGLHPTNGVQLLWFLIILVLAMLAQTKTVLLFATLTVTFALNALCYVVIVKIGTLIKQPVVALGMAGLWALQSLPFRIYSTGMENSLHALVFWCALWQCTVFLLQVARGETPNWWAVTVVLILNAWTRLDSALFSVLLYGFCLGTLITSYSKKTSTSEFARKFFQEHGKKLIGSICLAGAGFIAQLALFWLIGGSVLPVSALVKTSGTTRGISSAAIDKFIEVFTLGIPSILQGRLPNLLLIVIGLSGVLWVLREYLRRDTYSQEVQSFLRLWLCLLVGESLYHLYIAVSGAQYTLYFMWYRSPSFIFWIITASLIGFFLFERVTRTAIPQPLLRWVPLTLGLIPFALAIYLFGRSINFTSDLYVTRYDAAQWVANNSTPDTVYASWNTGQLSFFSNRRFINLDGVINDVDYYQRVLQGHTPLTEYLAENNVDFLVDYDTYDAVPEFPVTRTFPINDGSGRAIHIWQITPPISAAP